MSAPVLSICAVDRELAQVYPWVRTLGIGRGKTEQQARRAMAAQQQWEAEQRRRFRQALPAAHIAEVPQASHYVFLSHPDLVEREMRAFLQSM